MNPKRLPAAALALTLTAALAPAALAESPESVIAPRPQTYAAVLTLNGETLDTSGIPAADAGMIPMRLLAESDYGFAQWYPEEHQSFFSLDGNSILVDFSDCSVAVNGETLEGVKAVLTAGVTFLPAQVVGSLEGYGVELTPEPDSGRVDVTSPNALPLTRLARQIISEAEMACSFKNSGEELREYMGIDTGNFEEIVSFSPMMINADTLILGRYAEGADKTAAKEQLEACRAATEQSFEHYLPHPYELAQNGRVVESADGNYLMLVISEDNDKAIELFEAAAAQLSAGT